MSLFNLDQETGKDFYQKPFMALLDGIFSQVEAHEKDIYKVSKDPLNGLK